MKPKHQRVIFILSALVIIAIAVGFVLKNFEDNLVFFYSPTELQTMDIAPNTSIRIGGMVMEGSVVKMNESLRFKVTDYESTLEVYHEGDVPALFREGQGVVADGVMQVGGVFAAKTILAKHDENYMPPEVAKSLKSKEDYVKKKSAK